MKKPRNKNNNRNPRNTCEIGSMLTIKIPKNNVSSAFMRGGSRTAETSKMECFMIIVNG